MAHGSGNPQSYDVTAIASPGRTLPTRATGAGSTCSPRNKESGLYLEPVQYGCGALLGARAMIDRDVKIEHARIAHSQRLYGCRLYLQPVQ